MKYLHLIRYKNILLLAFMQLVVLFGFLKMQDIPIALALWQYYLLILSTISIAAGGYIINDIMDQEVDKANKPNQTIVGVSVSESTAYNLYVVCTLIGVGIGFYLSKVILRPNFVTVFIFCAALLYIYATNFKQIPFVKNIVVAFLLAFSIFIIALFLIFPATDETNKEQMLPVFAVLLDFGFAAFLLNFIREIVKDLEDIQGDFQSGIRTIPVILGVAKTTKILFGFSFVPILGFLYYIYTNLFELQWATVYILGFIIGPLLYFSIKIFSAKTKKEFAHLSDVMKLIIFLGIIAIAVIGINMKLYASA